MVQNSNEGSINSVFKNKVNDIIEEVDKLKEELNKFYDDGFEDEDLEKLQNRWLQIVGIVLRTE